MDVDAKLSKQALAASAREKMSLQAQLAAAAAAMEEKDKAHRYIKGR